ncbi:MAG TPA: carboxypeptidase regulatory-like domain-containing protein [Vicinamibacterales bacterium]|jgi:outer membrane receptor protein involved in Fe transport
MRVARLVTLSLALVLATSVLPLYAQTDTGSVDGRVFDEQKGGMPGVTVTAKNVDTGRTRSTTSGSTGSFHLESLSAGTWDLTAEIQGFSIQVRKGVTVQIGSKVNVDFTMKVGNLSETVVVTGEAPLVQTTRSDVGQVITTTMVENMPLNGRKFQDLSLLVPGTRPSNYYDPTKTEVGGISYGGLTGRSVNISVDGGDNNDGVVRGLLQQFSADAIQEYKVTTQRYSAEFGRSTGGLVNVITKSGTNEMRGSAFLFARNEKLNSETYFEQQSGAGRQPFSQQQTGATIGGPLAKDKAFFFLSYEYNRRQDYATVFTNHVLPSEEGPQLRPFRDHLLTAKTDLQLTPNNHLLVRYALENQRRDHDFIGGSTLKSAGATNTNLIHSIIGKNATVLGNSKLNEFVVLYQFFDNNILAEDNTKPGIATPDFTFGANLNTPQETIQKRIQVKDDFSFRKEGWAGDHDFKVGGELIRSHYGGFFTPSLYGSFNFASRLPGNSINAYLNAIADTFTGSAGQNEANDDWTYVAAYFQDDWKPRSNFTVNMGLRWEMQAGPYQNNFDTPVLRTLKTLGYQTERKQDLKDFGPRVGFAWDVRGDGRTVVRGGWGIYYDEIFQNITLYEKWNDVRTPLFFVSASPAPFTAAHYAANRDAIRNSFIDPTFAGQIMRLTAPNLKQPYSQQFNVGFSHSLNRNVSLDVDYIHALGEREIHRWTIDTSLNRNTDLSPAGTFQPLWGRINVEGNRGHSKIDGLYVTGKVRMKQAELITTYSLTKGMNIANDFGSYPGDLSNTNWEGDWGPMPNDVRHRFTLGGVFQLPGGFQVSSSIQANTGKPVNPVQGLSGQRNAIRAIDPTTGRAFGRNSFRGPSFATWDARVAKYFRFAKGRSVEVLFEVFNLTDRINLSGDTAFGYNNVWGRGTSPLAGFGTATQIVPNSNRQAEFGIRFKF